MPLVSRPHWLCAPPSSGTEAGWASPVRLPPLPSCPPSRADERGSDEPQLHPRDPDVRTLRGPHEHWRVGREMGTSLVPIRPPLV
jgi:hypothetical protein